MLPEITSLNWTLKLHQDVLKIRFVQIHNKQIFYQKKLVLSIHATGLIWKMTEKIMLGWASKKLQQKNELTTKGTLCQSHLYFFYHRSGQQWLWRYFSSFGSGIHGPKSWSARTKRSGPVREILGKADQSGPRTKKIFKTRTGADRGPVR